MSDLVSIVIVDDNDTDTYLSERVIRVSKMAEVRAKFRSAVEALAWLRETPRHADIILLDIHMPVMNGFEFLDRYAELDVDHRANAVIVMLTSLDCSEDRDRVVAKGAEFAPKPLSLASLKGIATAHRQGR